MPTPTAVFDVKTNTLKFYIRTDLQKHVTVDSDIMAEYLVNISPVYQILVITSNTDQLNDGLS